jgi:hypothetical protein
MRMEGRSQLTRRARGEPYASLVIQRHGSGLLDARTMCLRLQPAAFGSDGRPGGYPRDRWFSGAFDQLDQSVKRGLPIAVLGAVALGRDQQRPILREPPAGKPPQPRLHVVWQARGSRIESQLNRRRNLVDVLSTGSRRADEAF